MRRSIATVLTALAALASSVEAVITPFGIEAIKGPTCLVVDSSRSAQVPLAPFFTRVNVVVTDGLAQATMVQSFANPLPHSTEIAYVFPLPENGAVHAMSYQIHDSLFRATIQEKQRAQAIYDSIKNRGGNAAILLQERPNVFQQKMASVRTKDTVHVQIELSIPLKYADGAWELAFPTMVGERYQSGGASGVAGTLSGWNPPEDRDGPGLQFNVLLKNASFDSVWSPTHAIEPKDPSAARQFLAQRGLVDSTGTPDPAYRAALVLKPLATYPNRDFVLRMRRASTGIDAIASSWKPAGTDTGYFHLAILPDLSADSAGIRPPLDLVVLVDRSGSQSGWPMDREKAIASDILGRLAPTDRFTLLAFDDVNEYALGPSPVAATAENIQAAKRFVAGLSPRGGTQLLSAVNAALSTPMTSEMQRVFVFLTDGFITNEGAILDAIQKHSPKPQVLTFGCGDNLNRYFLEEAASIGGGFATILTSTEPAGPAVEAAWSRIETPQVNALRIDFGSMGAHDLVLPASDRLYKGLPLVADGKYLVGGRQTITLKGHRGGQAWTLSREVDLAEGSSTAWSVPKTWARAAIGRLDLAEGTTNANKDSIVKLSTAFQVLSEYTAFLATRGEPVESGASLGNAYYNSLITEVRSDVSMRRAGLRILSRKGALLVRWASKDRVDRVRILDAKGAVVRTISVEPGRVEAAWDGRSEAGQRMVAGTYFVELAGAGISVRERFAWVP
jgi:Ca-activated chloride channel family protein